MPTLVTQVFADDHHPPHCHIVSAEFEAIIRIDILGVMEGRMTRRALETALEWVRHNRETILNEWNRLDG